MSKVHSDDKWCCSKCILEKLPFHNTNNNELILVNLGADSTINNTLSLIPNSDNDFISECQKISINSEIPLLDQDDNFYTQINSQYYNISEINKIKHNKEASFNLIHTNLASIAKHHDNLQLTSSLLKI